MKLINLLLVVSAASSSFAESKIALPPVDLRPGQVVEGNLFSVKVIPGNAETSFFIVGKEVAKVKLQAYKVDLILDPEGAQTTYSLKRKNEAFVLNQNLQKDARIEIKSEDGHIEKLRLKVRP